MLVQIYVAHSIERKRTDDSANCPKITSPNVLSIAGIRKPVNWMKNHWSSLRQANSVMQRKLCYFIPAILPPQKWIPTRTSA
jgi:hypothetical protein